MLISLTHPDLCRHHGATGVKVQCVETRAASGLGVEESGGAAEGVEEELHRIQLGIWRRKEGRREGREREGGEGEQESKERRGRSRKGGGEEGEGRERGGRGRKGERGGRGEGEGREREGGERGGRRQKNNLVFGRAHAQGGFRSSPTHL